MALQWAVVDGPVQRRGRRRAAAAPAADRRVVRGAVSAGAAVANSQKEVAAGPLLRGQGRQGQVSLVLRVRVLQRDELVIVDLGEVIRAACDVDNNIIDEAESNDITHSLIFTLCLLKLALAQE